MGWWKRWGWQDPTKFFFLCWLLFWYIYLFHPSIGILTFECLVFVCFVCVCVCVCVLLLCCVSFFFSLVFVLFSFLHLLFLVFPLSFLFLSVSVCLSLSLSLSPPPPPQLPPPPLFLSLSISVPFYHFVLFFLSVNFIGTILMFAENSKRPQAEVQIRPQQSPLARAAASEGRGNVLRSLDRRLPWCDVRQWN